MIAADPDAGRRWVASPVPLTERLSREITGRLAALPESTQVALLHAAVVDGADPHSTAAAGVAGSDVDVFVPAERAGLVQVDQSGLQFSHPIVRSAIYHSAPFALAGGSPPAGRGRAGRSAGSPCLALGGCGDRPGRRGGRPPRSDRHPSPAAGRARSRRRWPWNAPPSSARARRTVLGGSWRRPRWRCRRDNSTGCETSPPEGCTDRRPRTPGRRPAESRGRFGIDEPAGSGDLGPPRCGGRSANRGLTRWAWDALGNAATAANYLGTPAGYQSVRDALESLDRQDSGPLDADQLAEIQDLRLWIQASSDRFASRDKVLPLLHRPVLLRLEVAGAAFALDESQLAAALYRDAVERLRAPEVRGTSAGALMALGFSLYDTGHWDEALVVASEADEAAAAYKLGVLAGFANFTPAMIHARRGNLEAARRHADKALAGIDTEQNRTVVTAIRHAMGVAAIADGSYLMAFTQLCRLFAVDGTPTHVHRSYLGVADLAEAAVRAERPNEGRELLRRVHANFHGTPSPRLTKLFGLARATLAEPGQAEAHFEQALSDPATSQWPFERAQAPARVWTMAATAATDQRSQTRPARSPRPLPKAPRHAIHPPSPNRASSLRSHHRRRARHGSGVDSPTTRDRPPGQRGTHQPGDR